MIIILRIGKLNLRSSCGDSVAYSPQGTDHRAAGAYDDGYDLNTMLAANTSTDMTMDVIIDMTVMVIAVTNGGADVAIRSDVVQVRQHAGVDEIPTSS